MALRCLGSAGEDESGEDHTQSIRCQRASQDKFLDRALRRRYVGRRRLLFADLVTRMGEEHLPKRVMFGEIMGLRATPKDRSETG